MTTQIKLYEDNAGGLTIVADGKFYSGFERIDAATFEGDAECIDNCDTEYTPCDPCDPGQHIASYEFGEVELVGDPGLAGWRYLRGDKSITIDGSESGEWFAIISAGSLALKLTLGMNPIEGLEDVLEDVPDLTVGTNMTPNWLREEAVEEFKLDFKERLLPIVDAILDEAAEEWLDTNRTLTGIERYAENAMEATLTVEDCHRIRDEIDSQV